jgi:hypothetical protein
MLCLTNKPNEIIINVDMLSVVAPPPRPMVTPLIESD